MPRYYIGQPQPHHVGLLNKEDNNPTLLINPLHINFDPLWTRVCNALPHQQAHGILTEESNPQPVVHTNQSQLYTDTPLEALPVTENPHPYYCQHNLLAHRPLTLTSDNNSSHLDPANCLQDPTQLLVSPANSFYGPHNYCPPDLWKSQGCDDLCILYNLVADKEAITDIISIAHYTQQYTNPLIPLPLTNTRKHYSQWAQANPNLATAWRLNCERLLFGKYPIPNLTPNESTLITATKLNLFTRSYHNHIHPTVWDPTIVLCALQKYLD